MLLFALDCPSDYANQHIMLTKQHYSSSFFFCGSINIKSLYETLYFQSQNFPEFIEKHQTGQA